MLSDGGATRTFCYVGGLRRRVQQGTRPGTSRRGLQHRCREAGDLDGRARGALADSVGAASVMTGTSFTGSAPRRLPRRQSGPAVPGDREGSRELGYEPRVNLDEGIRRSLVWYRREFRGGRGVMKVCGRRHGYVGLVTGVCLAEKGHEVACVDLDQEEVRAVARGRAPISKRASRSCFRATSATIAGHGDLEAKSAPRTCR